MKVTVAKEMEKYTTEQLQEALIGLRTRSDKEASDAYEMVFDELCNRMGDEAFDVWCTQQGW